MKPINFKLLRQIFFILTIIVLMIFNTYRNVQLHRMVDVLEKHNLQITKVNLTVEMMVSMAYKNDSTRLNEFQRMMLKAVIDQDYKKGFDKMFVHKPSSAEGNGK